MDEHELACYDKRNDSWRSFLFDRVWRLDSTQADVFADVEPLVLSVIEGYNTCLFAYGQTGSGVHLSTLKLFYSTYILLIITHLHPHFFFAFTGKTWTMNGYGTEYGVSYRTLSKIFEVLQTKQAEAESYELSAKVLSTARQARDGSKSTLPSAPSSSRDLLAESERASIVRMASTDSTVDAPVGSQQEDEALGGGKRKGKVTEADDDSLPFSYAVEVSMMEIYNDQVYDLLREPSSGSSAANEVLDIRQAGDGTVHVPGLKQVKVDGLHDVLTVFAKGTANRATAATNLNELSSRSHSILAVDVSTTVKGTTTRAKLYLVDLAGSERAGKSGVSGAAMKETQHINKSLSALGDVMEALDNKSKHVPYRSVHSTYIYIHFPLLSTVIYTSYTLYVYTFVYVATLIYVYTNSYTDTLLHIYIQ